MNHLQLRMLLLQLIKERTSTVFAAVIHHPER